MVPHASPRFITPSPPASRAAGAPGNKWVGLGRWERREPARFKEMAASYFAAAGELERQSLAYGGSNPSLAQRYARLAEFYNQK